MIDITNPAELRELMAKVTPGPWKVDTEYMTEPGYGKYVEQQWVYKEEPADPVEDDPDDEPGMIHYTIARLNWRNPITANTAFIALSREALPYWIERAEQAESELDERRELQEAQSRAIVREQKRAEQAERAVERLVNRVIEAEECTGGIPQGQAPCDAESEFYAGKACATCWLAWAMKEDE